MGFYDKYVCVKPATAVVAGFTGAAPQQVNGAAFLPEVPDKRPVADSVYAEVYVKTTTNLITLTGKWQISHDGTTWLDCVPSNGATNVALLTGTGSALTRTVAVAGPSPVYGSKYSRFVVVSGAAVGGGAGTDEASITYGWAKS